MLSKFKGWLISALLLISANGETSPPLQPVYNDNKILAEAFFSPLSVSAPSLSTIAWLLLAGAMGFLALCKLQKK